MTIEEYNQALNNISDSFSTLGDQVNQALEYGRQLGYSDIQIGDDIREKLKGIKSMSTIQRMLPDTAKHKEFSNKPKAVKMNAAAVKMTANQARLVTDQEPTIPPSPHVIREAETQQEREPPKSIDTPINIVNNEVFLSCRKFSTEIRMGLLNNSVLKLRLNMNNEVIEIT